LANLLENIPSALPEELSEVLIHSQTLTIERIVSRGHTSPAGFWYDQALNEFVVLLQGAARVAFDSDRGEVSLKPGDCLTIAAHERHRVVYTADDRDTVWLAIHYQ
jgi:cupin 2 domain-containing protein